jgi:hypothetical protein
MPQGLLQVNRFVTPQNLMCTVSGAINRAKSHHFRILPVTITRSRFCGGNFFVTQWNQDFSYTKGEGGRSVVGCQWSVVRRTEDVSQKLLPWRGRKRQVLRCAHDGKMMMSAQKQPRSLDYSQNSGSTYPDWTHFVRVDGDRTWGEVSSHREKGNFQLRRPAVFATIHLIGCMLPRECECSVN